MQQVVDIVHYVINLFPVVGKIGVLHTIYQEAVKDEALVEVTQNELRALDVSIPVRPEKPSTNKVIRITQTLEPALACDPPQLRVCGSQFPELRDGGVDVSGGGA